MESSENVSRYIRKDVQDVQMSVYNKFKGFLPRQMIDILFTIIKHFWLRKTWNL